MDNICIIPAKKNSSRFKNKNIAPFKDGNLITHTVEQVQKCNIFDRIILVSNDQSILDMGRKYNIETCFFRNVGKQIIDVIRMTINDLDIDGDSTIGLVLVTCPLRIPEDIVMAYNLFISSDKYHSVVSVKANENPIQMAFETDPGGHLQPVFPEDFYRSTRKQDHPNTFHFNDAVIFDTAEKFMKPNRTLYGDWPIPYLMPWERSIAIDYPFQYKIAKLLGE
jgi:CMP-N-acetylneuraminic acid synthetase